MAKKKFKSYGVCYIYIPASQEDPYTETAFVIAADKEGAKAAFHKEVENGLRYSERIEDYYITNVFEGAIW